MRKNSAVQTLEQFLARVNLDGPVIRPELGPCHVWSYGQDGSGYGALQFAGTPTRAHRVAWMLSNGPIPNRLCVLHHCDNRLCVRATHLFLGTRTENAADMMAKGRHGNVVKTICMRGHPFTEVNTRIDRRGKRRCRLCDRDWMREFRAKKNTVVNIRPTTARKQVS